MSQISVIMPVYNGEKYLRESIDCMLNQTFADFEILIMNDGSRDGSEAIIKSYSDPRIKYFKQENQGLAQTLNNLIKLARGEFIARQDQDDISLPQRLEKQVNFLLRHSDFGMVGTWSQIIEDDKLVKRFHKNPVDDFELRFDLLFHNPFVHSSMMLRREIFEQVGMYSIDKGRQPPEDYELWSRVARKFKIANIPEVLHNYREVQNSISRTGINPFLEKIIIISQENLIFEFSKSEIINSSIAKDIAFLTKKNDIGKANSLETLLDSIKKLNQHPKGTREFKIIRRKIRYQTMKIIMNYPCFSIVKILLRIVKMIKGNRAR